MARGFRIAARALRQLGAELITSDDVALNELIKNAFDARSPRVSVSIFAQADISALALLEEQVQDGSVKKKEAIERGERALSPDLPIAERSALMEQMRQHIGNRDGFAAFLREFRERQAIVIKDTGKGMSRADLEDRFLVIGTAGKLIEKRSARPDEPALLGEKGIGRLSMMRLGGSANVRSKQKGSDQWNQITFEWDKFDDPSLYLDDVEVEVEPAEKDRLDVQGTEITITNLSGNWTPEKVKAFIDKYIRRLQDPFVTSKFPYPIDIILNGQRLTIASLPKWLADSSQFKAEIIFDPDGISGTKHILRRSLTWKGATSPEIRAWEKNDLTRQLALPADVFASLGPFKANCLWFNRQMLSHNGVDRSRSEIIEELNHWCGGFSVYRDNFRVGMTGGMDDDWLEWDSGALKAKGFTLNRYQTVGSVSISSKNNPHLIDAANRERLISCPEQLLLKALLGDVIVQDFRMHINATREAEAKIAIAEESTEESLRRSEVNLKKTIATVDEIGKALPKEQRHKVAEIRSALHGQVEHIKIIKNALSLARETRVELLELANIGLVVEIVIHELARLTERTGELLVDIKTSKRDDDILQVVDNLRDQINATNKRIRTVDAMSPSGRHKKEKYDAVAQTKHITAGFSNRFTRHHIDWVVSLDGVENPEGKLQVYMVRGLIAQALENLLSNSVYWLQQGLRDGDEQRTITIDIDSKALTVEVWDNGPGVDPRYAKEIFKPYYSTRKKGKGLGLYIASELVEYHGGKLYLNENPEEDGRLRTFVIELPREHSNDQ